MFLRILLALLCLGSVASELQLIFRRMLMLLVCARQAGDKTDGYADVWKALFITAIVAITCYILFRGTWLTTAASMKYLCFCHLTYYAKYVLCMCYGQVSSRLTRSICQSVSNS